MTSKTKGLIASIIFFTVLGGGVLFALGYAVFSILTVLGVVKGLAWIVGVVAFAWIFIWACKHLNDGNEDE